MGLVNSPAFAQSRMEEVLRGVEDTEIYIDDIEIFSNSWESHLKRLDTVLDKLQENNVTINPRKCEWAVKETDWLGYWLTPNGIKPWTKKVDAILNMKAPSNATELRTFLGIITYYRDMWPRRSHILAPFTNLAGLPKKAKLEWTEELDLAFERVKAIIVQDVLMSFPNHNTPFDIFTDSSDYQMGACLMQDGKPVAYYSRKLSKAQKKYTTMEKELLAIVMFLREFRSMLLGADINIYTDHKNLTFANFNTQRVLRWRCYVEEYAPKLFYLQGKLNVLADAFSRLPRFDSLEIIEGKSLDSQKQSLPPQNPTSIMDLYTNIEESKLLECLKYLPEMDDYYNSTEHMLNLPSMDDNPLSYIWLKDTQNEDPKLKDLCEIDNSRFHTKIFADEELICYTENGKSRNTDWKICQSDTAVHNAVKFFHILLNHPGKTKNLTRDAWILPPCVEEDN